MMILGQDYPNWQPVSGEAWSSGMRGSAGPLLRPVCGEPSQARCAGGCLGITLSYRGRPGG